MTSTQTNERSFVDQVNDQIDSVITILQRLSPDDAEFVQRTRSHRPATPAVVVVGETKRGKSSLINALLNMPGLSPVDPSIATSTYLVFRKGIRDVAHAVLPGTTSPVEIAFDELSEWATQSGSQLQDHSPPRMIDVECTSPLLTNLVLIDTPGAGGLDSAHGEIALAAARQATALLFVTDASAPLTSGELAFLNKASEFVDLVLFALTKIDAYRGWKEILEDNKALLKKHAPRFSNAEFLPISSKLFEQAAGLTPGDVSGMLRTQSQIMSLQLALQTKVVAKASALHDANTLRTARTLLSTVDSRLQTNQQALDPESDRAVALRQNRDRLLQARRQDGRTWQLRLRAEMSRARIDTTHQVQREIREQHHYWRTTIDRANPSDLKKIPEELDAVLHASSIRILQGLLDRLRDVTDTALRNLFEPRELAEVYTGFAREPVFTSPVLPPEKRQPNVEDKIVLFGGLATGLGAGRLVAYLPAMAGLGMASFLVAPITVGLGLSATAWMVRSRKHVADKNHYKVWVSEALAEARGALDNEVASQFVDAEQALTLALDQAIARRVEHLDDEIKQIDESLRLNTSERQRRLSQLAEDQKALQQVCMQTDRFLAILGRFVSPTQLA